MTLIIYIHCTDAVILASDRKESNVSDVGQAVQKYYIYHRIKMRDHHSEKQGIGHLT